MTPKPKTKPIYPGAFLALLIAGCATTAPPTTTATPPTPPAVANDSLALSLSLDPPRPAAALEAAAPEAAGLPVNDENAVYFASGSTVVDAAGEEKLRAHAARLSADRKVIVTLIGLTDDQGSRSFNLLLAEQRIESVARILRAAGVAKSQIRPYALGSKAAGSDCRSAACRGRMRRVELDYSRQ